MRAKRAQRKLCCSTRHSTSVKTLDDFLRLLARENHDHQFTYFGELRAEGIRPETAQLLRAANFTEVEIGLQVDRPPSSVAHGSQE